MSGWACELALLGAFGSVASVVSVVLASAIYRWTKRDTTEMETRLQAALAAVRDAQSARDLSGHSVDLQRIDDGECQAALQRELRAMETVVRLDRGGVGKGNHTWHAVTSQGRLISLSKGGRGRRGVTVHLDEAVLDRRQ